MEQSNMRLLCLGYPLIAILAEAAHLQGKVQP